MFTFDYSFSTFFRLMETERIWLDPDVDFPCICRILNVPRRPFDRFLYNELGFRGAEILSLYRRSDHKMS